MSEAGELVDKCKPRCKITDISECERPKLLGNIFVILYAVNALSFMFTVIGHYQGMVDVLSPDYARLGFCIANADESGYYNTILIYCFCFDLAFTILLFGIVKMYKGSTSEFVIGFAKKEMGAVCIHGLTHFYQAFMPPPGGKTEYVNPKSPVVLIALLFWFFFLRSIVGEKCSKRNLVALTMAVSLVNILYVPLVLAFVYVNFTIQMVLIVRHFVDPEPHSVARNIIIGVPTSVVSWVEALACKSFLWHLGGHLVFDVTLAFSGLAHFFYMKAAEEEHHSKAD